MSEQIPEASAPAIELVHPRQQSKAWALRAGAATLALSGVYTLAANIDHDIPAWAVGPDATPARTVMHHVPASHREVPGTIATQTVRGAGLHLNELQKHAPTFVPSALNAGQRTEIERYVDRLFDPAKGVRRVDVTVMGRASDEDYTRSVHGDRNIGKPSADNARLARKRGRLVAAVIEKYAQHQGYHLNIDAVGGKEAIWNTSDIHYLNQVEKQYGKSRDKLISDYNHGRAGYLDSDAAGLLYFNLTTERGANVSSTITRELKPNIGACDVIASEVTTPGHNVPETVPGHDGWKFRFGIVPFPFGVRLRRRVRAVKMEAPNDSASAEPDTANVAEPEAVEAAAAERPDITTAEVPARVTRRMARGRRQHDRYRAAVRSETDVYVRRIRGEATPRELRQAQRATERARRAVLSGRRDYGKLGYAVLALPVLLFPWFHTDHDEAHNKAPVENCVSYDVAQGSRTTTRMTTLGLLGWAKWHHRAAPSIVMDQTESYSYLRPTHRAYTKYTVDQNGRVIEKTPVPATELPVEPVAPTFAK